MFAATATATALEYAGIHGWFHLPTPELNISKGPKYQLNSFFDHVSAREKTNTNANDLICFFAVDPEDLEYDLDWKHWVETQKMSSNSGTINPNM